MAQRLMVQIRRMVCMLAASLLAFSAVPAVVFADTAGDPAVTPSSTSCTPVNPTAGIQQPTGSDAGTYTYNSCTGLWENQYYTWSPVTKTATPKTPLVYTCDHATWTWLTNVWTYNAARGSYYQVPTHVSALPVGAAIDPTSLNPCAPPVIVSSVTSPSDPSQSDVAGTSTNSTTVGMQNQVLSSADSGSATVNANTLGGDATSGDAAAMATIVNAVQSSSSLLGGPVATFTATINGDVQGDLVIDPTQLQPASGSGSLSANNLDVTNQTNGQITNNIVLAASTGSASVTDNTKAGSAATGNATAVANVVNLLNSLVSAGKSFVGVINISGNMHGNILLPQQLLDNLIASNAPSTTVMLNGSQANNLGITNTNNLSTTNNVHSTATSGSAAVTNNTAAGSATTGSVSTQVRIFNLTGSQVVSANCLLVFVNVSGKWIGVIFNAPAGATAAALGSGVTGSTVNNAVITSATNDSITNNINVAAASGNALVSGNTAAGNATSGNANAAVNLLNINNSAFNVSGWFGILFINIFGDWYGSLGIYDPAVQSGAHGSHAGAHTNTSQTFQFIPKAEEASNSAKTKDGSRVDGLANTLVQNAADTLAHTVPASKIKVPGGMPTQLVGGIIVAVGLTLFAAERIMTARQVRSN